MLESLSDRLTKTLRNISGKGKLSEKNMDDMLREVRMSLLEADVNYMVVKEFIQTIKLQCIGMEVSKALNPGQQVVSIVHKALIQLLGEETAEIQFKPSGITTIMMVGLQGTGKTTASAKIANLLKNKKGRKVLLVACDVIRPAAIEQLQTLGKSIDVEVYTLGVAVDAVETARGAMEYAKANGFDTVMFDTAGRLHIDEELMHELSEIKELVKPDDILLTVDAMTGQDIVNVAQSFHDQLSVTGLVLTKLDGDSRGGGILSVRAMTGVPVKFTGIGEKIDDLDIFHPDRMADRILGMGDMMTLIEQAQEKMDQEEAERTSKRMMSGEFDLEDMLSQFKQMKKMGSMSKIMRMVPGMGDLIKQIDEDQADKGMKMSEAIIQSMTKEERRNPDILRASRKARIANGSGTTVAEVNKLLKQFEKTKKMMDTVRRMSNSGISPDQIDVTSLLGMANNPGGMPRQKGPATGNQKKFKSKLKKRR